jgi:hypothetical protein
LHKKTGKSFEVALPELTDGVMIGMPVCRYHPEGDILVGSLLDLAGTGNPSAVSIEQKGRHHPGFVGGLSISAQIKNVNCTSNVNVDLDCFP